MDSGKIITNTYLTPDTLTIYSIENSLGIIFLDMKRAVILWLRRCSSVRQQCTKITGCKSQSNTNNYYFKYNRGDEYF